jgi:hypothetical protein
LGHKIKKKLLQYEPEIYDRAQFAANVAEALINIGVRCVVAAGWAVDDGAAKDFAATFYDALVRGERFLDAVAYAREAAWKNRGHNDNSWAAYQCYGDADWRLNKDSAYQERSSVSSADESSNVASSSELLLALETLAVNARYTKIDKDVERTRLQRLEQRYAPKWGGIGAVAEAFGLAWAELGNWGNAIVWYESALAARDGSATLKAAERLGNLRARFAWETLTPIHRLTKAKGTKNRKIPMDGEEKSNDEALSKARKDVQGALKLLEQLVQVKSTVERENLCGSAYKRLAMIEALANARDAELKAIKEMKSHYAEAEKVASLTGDPGLFYSALNRISAELIIDAGEPSWKGLDRLALASLNQTLNNKIRTDPDFWSVVGLVELQLYEFVGQKRLAAGLPSILEEYEDLYRRVNSTMSWSSVRDQAEFVLLNYLRRAGKEEQEASVTLLKQLAVWAGSDKERINNYVLNQSSPETPSANQD